VSVRSGTGAVWLHVDEIENAMRRNGLTADQTGIAAYSVAHDLPAAAGCAHVVIETACPDAAEHQRRVEGRVSDLPGWAYPTWDEVRQAATQYQPRTDERLRLDTTRPVDESRQAIQTHLLEGTGL
jgi:hypothetical protein